MIGTHRQTDLECINKWGEAGYYGGDFSTIYEWPTLLECSSMIAYARVGCSQTDYIIYPTNSVRDRQTDRQAWFRQSLRAPVFCERGYFILEIGRPIYYVQSFLHAKIPEQKCCIIWGLYGLKHILSAFLLLRKFSKGLKRRFYWSKVFCLAEMFAIQFHWLTEEIPTLIRYDYCSKW